MWLYPACEASKVQQVKMNMKEFKKLKEHCLKLGLEYLMTNKQGHAVYEDNSVPHTKFTDSSPHTKHIGYCHYKKASKIAADIQEVKRTGVVEQFIPHPPQYSDTYTFLGVHNEFTNGEGNFHEVCVTDMHDTIGTGTTLAEVLMNASLRLTCEINDMRARRDPVPKASSQEDVQAQGAKQASDPIAQEFHVQFCDVVAVNTLPGCNVPELSDSEIARIDKIARQVQASPSIPKYG